MEKDFFYYYNLHFFGTSDNETTNTGVANQPKQIDAFEQAIADMRKASWLEDNANHFVDSAVMEFTKGLGIKNGENIATAAEKFANMFMDSRSKLCQNKHILLALWCACCIYSISNCVRSRFRYN
jgi:hypothetical protein